MAGQVIDQVLAQENAEMEALVSMFEDQSGVGIQQPDEPVDYGSEGESYDSIFAEIMSRPSHGEHSGHHTIQDSTDDHRETESNDAMDTTGG